MSATNKCLELPFCYTLQYCYSVTITTISYSSSETDIKPNHITINNVKGKNSFFNAPNPFLAAYTCYKQAFLFCI